MMEFDIIRVQNEASNKTNLIKPTFKNIGIVLLKSVYTPVNVFLR